VNYGSAREHQEQVHTMRRCCVRVEDAQRSELPSPFGECEWGGILVGHLSLLLT